MIEGNSPQGIAGAQRAMAGRRDSMNMLSVIDVSSLIVVGSEDTLTPVAEGERMCNGIRAARLRTIEGAGHLSNLAQPEEFMRHLSTSLHGLNVKGILLRSVKGN